MGVEWGGKARRSSNGFLDVGWTGEGRSFALASLPLFRSDLAVSSQHGTAPARGQVIHSDGGVAPHGPCQAPPSGSLHTRRSLRALARVAQAVAESSASPAHMSGTRRLSHTH